MAADFRVVEDYLIQAGQLNFLIDRSVKNITLIQEKQQLNRTSKLFSGLLLSFFIDYCHTRYIISRMAH